MIAVPDKTEVRSVDVIVADMTAINDSEGDLSPEQLTRYEELQTELVTRQAHETKQAELRKAHAALVAAAPGQLVTGAKPKEDKTYERAFDSYMRSGVANADLVQSRAQSEGTATEGGYLVPDSFRVALIRRLKAYGGVGNVATEIGSTDGRPMQWPTVDDVANVGEIVSEGGTFSSGADIVFGTNNLDVYAYATGGSGSTPVRVSLEVLQDAAFDVEGLVASLLAERIGRIQATHLVSGTGVSQPKGITTGLTGIQTAANNALTYADLLKYVHAVDPAYRESGCRWVFNDKTLQTIEGLVDTQGRPLLKTSTDGVESSPSHGTLLGYPITVDQSFPDFNNASPTVNFGVFGNIAAGYVVRRVNEVSLLVDPYGRMHNRQVQYSAWARLGATQQNTNAYVALSGKT